MNTTLLMNRKKDLMIAQIKGNYLLIFIFLHIIYVLNTKENNTINQLNIGEALKNLKYIRKMIY